MMHGSMNIKFLRLTTLSHSHADMLDIRGAPVSAQTCNVIAVSFYVQDNITQSTKWQGGRVRPGREQGHKCVEFMSM
jgi:hypothetical protein